MDWVELWAALVEFIAPYYPEGHTGRQHLRRKPCCAFNSCSNGSPCPIPTWKRRFSTPLCCTSLPSSMNFPACQMRQPSSAFVTRWGSTNWSENFGPRQKAFDPTRPAAQGRHRNRRHIDGHAHVDQKQRQSMRPRNALQQNGQPVVLLHEGPHRR